MSSIGGKIANGTLWTALETWGHQAMLFAVFVILARLLGAHAIGLAALAMSAPVILAVPVTRGIPEAIIQRPQLAQIHLDSAFWFLVGCGAILSGLVWLSADQIASAFGEPELISLVHCTCIVILIQSIAAIPMAVLKRELRFRLLALRTLSGTLTGGAVGISLAIAGYGAWSRVWMQIVKTSVEVVLLLLVGGWRPRLHYSFAACRDLFGFAAPIAVFSLWQYVNEEIPKIVLGSFLGPNAVGIYTVARRPLELLTSVLLAPIAGITMPAVARLQDDRTRIDQFFDRSIRVAMFVGFPAFIGLAAIAPLIVPVVFGEHWSNSVVAVQILMLLGLVRTIDSICGGTVLAFGHSRLILLFNMAFTALAVVLMTAAAQVSVEAVTVAVVLCNLLLVPPFLYYTRRLVGIDVMKPLAILPRLILATLLMFLSVTAWRHLVGGSAQLIAIGSSIAVGVLVYGAATIALLRPDLLLARDLLLKARG